MKCFLTSDPVLNQALNPANELLSELKKAVPNNCNALFICSDPDGYARTDFFSAAMKQCFENSGFCFEQFAPLDHRNHLEAKQYINEADLIILAGGHVPTQNRFFQEIHLKTLLRGFHGTLLGISAGTMNSANLVYAHPEREGEGVDPTFQKFLPGLGLTKRMVLPHYQSIKNDVLDGLRVFEDIAYPDSMGREFYALVDGSYIFSHDGVETLHGEAYKIKNGELTKISSKGDVMSLNQEAE